MQGLLYHFTDEDGLVGIVESQCLWAVNFKDLNDRTEIQDILYHIKLYRNARSPSAKVMSFCDFTEEVINEFYLDEPERKADFYLSCFTSDSQSEDLWNNAKKNGKKEYALCFSAEKLNHLLSSCEKDFLIGTENIQQVIYDKRLKRKALEAWRKEYERVVATGVKDQTAYNMLIRRFICLPALFKNPEGWANQKEWRIIIRKPLSSLAVSPKDKDRIPKVVYPHKENKRHIKLFNDPKIPGFSGLSEAMQGIIIGPSGSWDVVKQLLQFPHLSHLKISHLQQK